MNLRKLAFYLIFVLLLTGTVELFSRIYLSFCGYPFFMPSEYVYTGFYSNMLELREKEVRRGGVTRNILILGGSVVSTAFSHMESRLDTILQKHYGESGRYMFYNIASPGHTSLDNALKYRLLEDKQFDLVIYYEAINENRANNIPPVHFRKDYTHMRWYRDVQLLLAHPEINVTVMPYLFHRFLNAVCERLGQRTYISTEQVDPQYSKYGADIKTGECYRQNVEEIIRTARRRGDPLILMSYASYFPGNVKLEGEKQDTTQFAKCYFAPSLSIWGDPEHVKKGIGVHNAAIRSLVKQYQPLFLDMEAKMPKDGKLFCDFCHLSESGAQRFAHEVVEFIIRSGIL